LPFHLGIDDVDEDGRPEIGGARSLRQRHGEQDVGAPSRWPGHSQGAGIDRAAGAAGGGRLGQQPVQGGVGVRLRRDQATVVDAQPVALRDHRLGGAVDEADAPFGVGHDDGGGGGEACPRELAALERGRQPPAHLGRPAQVGHELLDDGAIVGLERAEPRGAEQRDHHRLLGRVDHAGSGDVAAPPGYQEVVVELASADEVAVEVLVAGKNTADRNRGDQTAAGSTDP
jgi:hypothetical protein